MARKINKSAEVRKYLLDSPDMGPTEISAALKAREITVTPNFVSNVKLKLKNGSNGNGRRRSEPTIDDVMAAAEFIKDRGDAVIARKAIELAEKIVRDTGDTDFAGKSWGE